MAHHRAKMHAPVFPQVRELLLVPLSKIARKIAKEVLHFYDDRIRQHTKYKVYLEDFLEV
jgi:hypothetical protein